MGIFLGPSFGIKEAAGRPQAVRLPLRIMNRSPVNRGSGFFRSMMVAVTAA